VFKLANPEYQIPQEIIDSILADCGLESMYEGVSPQDDQISEK
jgi:hypothetical protein